jgi:hypothetical protein
MMRVVSRGLWIALGVIVALIALILLATYTLQPA